MNFEIAQKRYKDVLRVDVITNKESDFLATHVPAKKLYLANHLTANAELEGSDLKKTYSEEEVYSKLVDPSDDDGFTLVVGPSGTGKSHLIRWFNAALENRKPETETVLFVRRNDNTLKGTIKQLLDKEEVKNLPNKDAFKRLVKAILNENVDGCI